MRRFTTQKRLHSRNREFFFEVVADTYHGCGEKSSGKKISVWLGLNATQYVTTNRLIIDPKPQ
ncbi:MAG TPA: hypothetical protein VFJ27_03970, partial [Terriglobia bacterium]|nr:hypothetical protein [Terriglobia bacterium]